MIDDFRFNGGGLSAYAQKVTADMATGVHRWAEGMSATGRRQATGVAIAKLSDWRHGNNEERPARDEVKAWVAFLLDAHYALQRRAAGAERDFRELRAENEALTAQRDEALEALALARETVVRQVGRYEELRTAYDAAEAERNTLAKRGGGEK